MHFRLASEKRMWGNLCISPHEGLKFVYCLVMTLSAALKDWIFIPLRFMKLVQKGQPERCVSFIICLVQSNFKLPRFIILIQCSVPPLEIGQIKK